MTKSSLPDFRRLDVPPSWSMLTTILILSAVMTFPDSGSISLYCSIISHNALEPFMLLLLASRAAKMMLEL